MRARETGAPLRIALLGCGVVGSQVARLLGEQAADLAARAGGPLEIAGIAVRRPELARISGVDAALLTGDAVALVTRPDVDIVVELIGGIEPARSLVLAALDSGRSVVTANKALLASDGAALHKAASANGADLYYEAAVAGAIPLLRALRESLAGDTVRRVLGIVNGTTNFILDQMDSVGSDFGPALDAGAAAGLRGGRSDRRRAGPRRRREGGDPGRAGLPHRGDVGRRVHRGHHRDHRGRHRERAGARLRDQAAGDLRAVRRRGLGPGAPGDAAPGAPAGGCARGL